MVTEQEFVWLEEDREVTLVEVARTCALTEAEVRELMEYGALVPRDAAAADPRFGGDCLARLRRASRLCHDLELDLPAVALVVSFLERIEVLEAQVRQLTAQLPDRR